MTMAHLAVHSSDTHSASLKPPPPIPVNQSLLHILLYFSFILGCPPLPISIFNLVLCLLRSKGQNSLDCSLKQFT